jgi:hypothetical protein
MTASIFETSRELAQIGWRTLDVRAAALTQLEFDRWRLTLVADAVNRQNHRQAMDAFYSEGAGLLMALRGLDPSEPHLELILVSPEEQRGQNLIGLTGQYGHLGKPWANMDGRTFVLNPEVIARRVPAAGGGAVPP